jgi:trimethylamine--corrinoid protein Co-methyltransferase
MAHHWGIPALAGAYGTDALAAGSWQSAGEVALDPLLLALAGAEIATGIGLSRTYTLLYPEQIILDDDLYHRARYQLRRMEVSQETLAVDTIRAVGSGGHFLAQKHTRKYMKEALTRSVAHQLDASGNYLDPQEYARQRVDWIMRNYQPEPLEAAKQRELTRLLEAADLEIAHRAGVSE